MDDASGQLRRQIAGQGFAAPSPTTEAPAIPTAPTPPAMADATARVNPSKEPSGAWAVWLGLAIALMWLGALGGLAFDPTLRAQALDLPTAIFLVLCVAAAMPAFAFFLAGLCVRHMALARAAARKFDRAAEKLLSPNMEATGAAKSLAQTIRGQISAIDSAVSVALDKMEALDKSLARQAGSVGQSAERARIAAAELGDRLEGERVQLNTLLAQIDAASHQLADNAARQAQYLHGASDHLAERSEAAATAFERQAAALASASEQIVQKTERAQTSFASITASSNKLAETISPALDRLAQAAALVDGARASVDGAAGQSERLSRVLSDISQRTIADAQLLEAEFVKRVQTLRETAGAAWQRLTEASVIAQRAAEDARIAADAQASAAEKRLQETAEAMFAAASRADQAAETRFAQARRLVEKAAALLDEAALRIDARLKPFADARSGEEVLQAARLAGAAPSIAAPVVAIPEAETPAIRRPSAITREDGGPDAAPKMDPVAITPLADLRPRFSSNEPEPEERTERNQNEMNAPAKAPSPSAPARPTENGAPFQDRRNGWSWGDILTTLRDEHAEDAEAEELWRVINEAGVHPRETLNGAAMERVLARARHGGPARRRIVQEAAPDAVRRLRQMLAQDPVLQDRAQRFAETYAANLPFDGGVRKLVERVDTDIGRMFLLLEALG